MANGFRPNLWGEASLVCFFDCFDPSEKVHPAANGTDEKKAAGIAPAAFGFLR